MADPSGASEATARKELGAKLKSFEKDHIRTLSDHKPAMALVTLEAVQAPPVIRAALEANFSCADRDAIVWAGCGACPLGCSGHRARPILPLKRHARHREVFARCDCIAKKAERAGVSNSQHALSVKSGGTVIEEGWAAVPPPHNRYNPTGTFSAKWPIRLLTVFPGSTIQPLPIRVTRGLVRPILCQRELVEIGRALPPVRSRLLSLAHELHARHNDRISRAGWRRMGTPARPLFEIETRRNAKGGRAGVPILQVAMRRLRVRVADRDGLRDGCTRGRVAGRASQG